MKELILSILLLAAFVSEVYADEKNQKSQIKNQNQIQVQAHRGGRGRMPENSLEAFDYALQIGADVLELDLGVTKDGVLVVNHDSYVDRERCTDKNGKAIEEGLALYSLPLKEVQEFQCGMLPHKRFPQQKKLKVRIPTLREVFELVKNSPLPIAKTVRFNIETKLTPGMPDLTPSPDVFAQKVLELIKEYGFLNRVDLQSFDHRTLRAARKLEPKIVLSPLVENTLLNYTAMAKDLKAQIVSPNILWITKSEIADLHKAGVKTIPWTANEKAEWDRLVDLGVDGIISDYPEELIAYLRSKGLRQ